MPQPETTTPAKNSLSPDWFVRGILTRLGEVFDRFTGRNWKPSSSLATSQLIEKLKNLLDAEARDAGENVKVVPHHIKLKMEWDKFSVDGEESLKKLEIELLTAAIDHINDRRYHTYAPMIFEIKPDYFTEGVKLSASFDKFAEPEEIEPDEVNVTMPDLKNIVIPMEEKEIVEPEKEIFIASFTVNNQPRNVQLAFSPKERKSVGRTKENDLWLDDASVSKLHAALVLSSENQLIVADTGSTNGTFVSGVRIAYGKAIELIDTDELRFGTVNVRLERVAKEQVADEIADQNSSDEDFDTRTKFSAGEKVGIKNDYATRMDFPVKKIVTGENNSVDNISPGQTAKLSAVEDKPAADESISIDVKKGAQDFGEKIPVKLTKEEL